MWEYGGQRWLRLASLYPETIDSGRLSTCNDVAGLHRL
jgi:hypothetical protein